MKKFLVLMLVGIVALSIAFIGCGKEEAGDHDTAADKVDEAADTTAMHESMPDSTMMDSMVEAQDSM